MTEQLPLFPLPPAESSPVHAQSADRRSRRAGVAIPRLYQDSIQAEIARCQAIAAYQRLQRQIPTHLHEWGVDHVIYAGYRLSHVRPLWSAYTPLVTDWMVMLDKAIEQAERLIVIYSLGAPDVLTILNERQRGDMARFVQFPTLRHWHQYDPNTATRWYDEYVQRNPDGASRAAAHHLPAWRKTNRAQSA